MEELAFDPHKGKITSGSIIEREVILALEEEGYLEYAIRDTWGKGDFFDAILLKLYDIKSFEAFPLDNFGNPITSVNGGAFDVRKAMRNIKKECLCQVILQDPQKIARELMKNGMTDIVGD